MNILAIIATIMLVLLGMLLLKHTRLTTGAETNRGRRVFKRYLMHDRLLIRFGALLGVVMLIFLGTWTASYVLLPEGLLRGRTAAQVLAGADLAGGSVWLEWLRILALNLGIMGFVIIAPNLLRTPGDIPLGYSTVTVQAVVFGMVLGTNSFTVALGGKLPPSLAIFGSTGLYEIAAYVLAATATVSIARYRLVGTWPKQTTEPIIPTKTTAVIRERRVGVLLAIALLVAACGWEAYRFSLAIAS